MSILIKDMEMPMERGSINLTIKYNGTVLDTESGIQVAEAHEISPHGRLIDKDAIVLEDGPYEYDEWCEWALRQYQDAPIIIEADTFPILHGTFAATSEQEATRRLTGGKTRYENPD